MNDIFFSIVDQIRNSSVITRTSSRNIEHVVVAFIVLALILQLFIAVTTIPVSLILMKAINNHSGIIRYITYLKARLIVKLYPTIVSILTAWSSLLHGMLNWQDEVTKCLTHMYPPEWGQSGHRLGLDASSWWIHTLSHAQRAICPSLIAFIDFHTGCLGAEKNPRYFYIKLHQRNLNRRHH